MSAGGLRWTATGVQLLVKDPAGVPHIVHIPIQNAEVIYRRELSAAGCPLPPTVGAPTVGGLVAAVGRSKRKFGSRFVGALKKVGKAIGKVAKKIVQSKFFRAALGAVATAFPVLAPAAVAVEVANKVTRKIDKAKDIVQSVAKKKRKPTATEEQIVEAGARAKRGLDQMANLAKAGNPDAQRAMGAFVVARALQNNRRRRKPRQRVNPFSRAGRGQ
jgi:hypothetical protein